MKWSIYLLMLYFGEVKINFEKTGALKVDLPLDNLITTQPSWIPAFSLIINLIRILALNTKHHA